MWNIISIDFFLSNTFWHMEYYTWYYKVSGLCPLFCIKGVTFFEIGTISNIGQYLRVALSIWYSWVGAFPPFHLKRGTDPLYEIHSVLNLKTVDEVQKLNNLCKVFLVLWNNLMWVMKVKVSTNLWIWCNITELWWCSTITYQNDLKSIVTLK